MNLQRSTYAEKGPRYGGNSMLFIIGLVIALVAIGAIRRMRVAGGVDDAPLGRMSEQWLAEHRASHAE